MSVRRGYTVHKIHLCEGYKLALTEEIWPAPARLLFALQKKNIQINKLQNIALILGEGVLKPENLLESIFFSKWVGVLKQINPGT